MNGFVFIFFTFIFGCTNNSPETEQIVKVDFGDSSYFSQPHAMPIDVELDGERIVILTNENLFIVYDKEGKELERNKVGNVVKDGRGAPKMYPGGQIVKFWKNGNDDIELFNTVPFEFLVVGNDFKMKQIVSISDLSKEKVSTINVLAKRGDEYLISMLKSDRKEFLISWISTKTNTMDVVYSHKINEVRPFISGGKYKESGFFFLDNSKSSIKIVEEGNTSEIPIDLNKTLISTESEKRLLESWKDYGFSKEVRMTNAVFDGVHFLCIIRLTAREIEGLDENEYFILEVNRDNTNVKKIESVLSVTLSESGLVKIFSEIDGDVIFEQKPFELLD